MVVVASVEGWTATVQTLSGRARIGRDAPSSIEGTWTETQLRTPPSAELPPTATYARLRAALRAEIQCAEAATTEEARLLLVTARERIRPLTPQGEVVVVRDASRRPPAFVVELYDPALGAFQLQRGGQLAVWRSDAAEAFGEGWVPGPRPRSCRRSGRAGIALEVVCEAVPPWPDLTPVPVPPTRPDWAYAALGLPVGASEDEVHAAYLAHIKLNHPDRVAHLSAALQRTAHEETLKIVAAYEAIRPR